MSVGELKSAYLLSGDCCDDLVEDGALAIKNLGHEVNLFNQFVFLKNDYDFEKKMGIGSVEYNKWSDLEKYTMPFTDILIIDQYVFSDASLIPSNYIKCLEALHAKKTIQTNIIVYTDFDQFNRGQRSPVQIAKATKKAVKQITGIKPTFTLVLVKKQRDVDSFSEHDRTIWTNYFRLYTGDSINHFNSAGEKITTGREIHLTSHLKEENRLLSDKLIDDLQDNITKMRGKDSAKIYGDYISSVLRF
ncbi:MAG: hypothetical protein JEZ14_08265 [Marinilabiliaceae bacterium]|nr:hypothetical protein [Marinilabiliaceae bacterium]